MPWRTLDIAPTADAREIRRAYARQLKRRQHEEDAEFFSRLRWAYETALAWARENSREEIKEVPELFFTPAARIAPSIAKDISSEEIPEKPDASPFSPEPPQVITVVISEAPEEIPEITETPPEEIPAQIRPPIPEPDFAQDAEPSQVILSIVLDTLEDVPETVKTSPEEIPAQTTPPIPEPDFAQDAEPSQVILSIVLDTQEEVPEIVETPPEAIPAQTRPPILVPDFARDAKPVEDSDGETLESLFSTLRSTLEKNANSSLTRKRCLTLQTQWEKLQAHLRQESLAENEVFSERMAILLAGCWPASVMIWTKVRDYFHWQMPIFSDPSQFSVALRASFEQAEHHQDFEIPKHWLVAKISFVFFSIFAPLFLLVEFFFISKKIFEKRPSEFEAGNLENSWGNISKITMLAVRMLLFFFFYGIALLYAFYMIRQIMQEEISSVPKFLIVIAIISFIFFLLHQVILCLVASVIKIGNKKDRRNPIVKELESRLIPHGKNARFLVIYCWVICIGIPLLLIALVSWNSTDGTARIENNTMNDKPAHNIKPPVRQSGNQEQKLEGKEYTITIFSIPYGTSQGTVNIVAWFGEITGLRMEEAKNIIDGIPKVRSNREKPTAPPQIFKLKLDRGARRRLEFFLNVTDAQFQIDSEPEAQE